jgi:frataxin-like iron-binding protein CyaY
LKIIFSKEESLLFSFKAEKWLSEQQESFIDLLPEESSPKNGKNRKFQYT